MKQLLCYGDSNTWGLIPGTKERYPWGLRWTSILQEKLEMEVDMGLKRGCVEGPPGLRATNEKAGKGLQRFRLFWNRNVRLMPLS